jgi:hypothetical protein
VDFDLVAHLARIAVVDGQSSRLPFFIKTETSSAELVSEHLLRGEGLPEMPSHSEFPYRHIKAISFSLNPSRNSIKCTRRIFSKENSQLQRWRAHKRKVVDTDP